MEAIFASDIPIALAVQAHSGTSHIPAERAASTVASYAALLASDHATLAELAQENGTAYLLEAEFERYRAKYRTLYLDYLRSRSRVLSPMITGPANFPTARNQKRYTITNRRMNELCEFRARALTAIRRTLDPGSRPIMAGDADAVERLAVELEEGRTWHEHMKSVNVIIRKTIKDGADATVEALGMIGVDEKTALELIKPGQMGGMGYASFQLRNSNARIAGQAKRLASLKRAKATPTKSLEGADGLRVEDSPPDNRVRIFFPGKPDDGLRATLKRLAFRWTPSLGCWQAYRNYRTVKAAENILRGLPIPATL